jgi:hypothetical protein
MIPLRTPSQAPQADQPPVSRGPATVKPFPAPYTHALMHRGVYKIALLCWAAFLSVFWVTFWMSSNALFMVVIGTFYALMFFGVPIKMSRMAPTRPRTGSLAAFLRGQFATLDGPVSGLDALLQVVLVPVVLSLGGIAIGIIIHAARV